MNTRPMPLVTRTSPSGESASTSRNAETVSTSGSVPLRMRKSAPSMARPGGSAAPLDPARQWSARSSTVRPRHSIVEPTGLPWREAKEMWPFGCQSCVSATTWNCPPARTALIAATTRLSLCATLSFWTSTMRSAAGTDAAVVAGATTTLLTLLGTWSRVTSRTWPESSTRRSRIRPERWSRPPSRTPKVTPAGPADAGNSMAAGAGESADVGAAEGLASK
eukprot:Amastigsp_a509496_18.p2 type:complete len:221 gc:universal Amastigsp_a509496_18:821-159(-)